MSFKSVVSGVCALGVFFCFGVMGLFYVGYLSWYPGYPEYFTNGVDVRQCPRLANFNQTEYNQNPEFRAGTVLTIDANDTQGYGFLYEYKQYPLISAKTVYVTIEHVAALSRYCAYIGIPGHPISGLLDWEKFQLSTTNWLNDRVAIYKFEESVEEQLQQAIEVGSLARLRKAEDDPQAGELVVVPRANTGLYTYYQIVDVQSDVLVLQTDGSAGIICAGRSGGPVLRYDGTSVTDEVYGVVSAGELDATVGDCSYTIYAVRLP